MAVAFSTDNYYLCAMIPKKLYDSQNWLMIVSGGALVIVIALSLIALPFMRLFPYELICWLCDFYAWFFPIAFAVFAASSKVFVVGFKEHRMKRKDED